MTANFLIWSNQHGMWWRANERGYTQYIEEAGRYTAERAAAIVDRATLNGKLTHRRIDPVTEREYFSLDEVAVVAPESGGTR